MQLHVRVNGVLNYRRRRGGGGMEKKHESLLPNSVYGGNSVGWVNSVA